MASFSPPHPKRIPVTLEQLGRQRVDPYSWMKDENWQQVLRDPSILREDIAAHLREENAYCNSLLKETESLQETLFNEMVGRIAPCEESVPLPHDAWLYGVRFETNAQYPLHFRKPHPERASKEILATQQEDILLDVPKMAQQHRFYQIATAAHTDDHRYYIYAEDTQGSEVYQIKIKNIETGEICAPPIESTTGSFTISPDSQWIFWVYRDDNGRPARIYRRPLLGGDDSLVYDETDSGFFLSLGLTASRKWILIERGDHDTNETLLIPANDPTKTPYSAAPLKRGERYSLTHWNDRFIILTNAGNAIDFQLMQTSDHATDRPNWRPFLPYKKGHYLLNVSAGRDFLVWSERSDGNEQIYVLPASLAPSLTAEKQQDNLRQKAHSIKMDEPAYDLSLLGILEYNMPILRYIYQSPTMPAHWYDYNMQNHERILQKIKEIPSGHQPELYETRRLFAQAPDGESIPITLLMKKDTKCDGTAPLLLYGYGSYGISMEAAFSSNILNLVNRGWVYAIAHIRGGSEKGWSWFLEGRGKKKPNSFTDFIAVAHYLIQKKYTSPKKIIAQGGSAGGLLMGAIANMAPELFAGIAAQVPFVDMLNTMSDASLPLTPPEWPEWGNPLTDPEAYDLIASYSPYDNIKPQKYPAILAMGGLSDPRVTYWEPAKWIAKLRNIAQGGPFLCQINMEAGHGGSSGRFARLKEIALIQAFAIWALQQQNPS